MYKFLKQPAFKYTPPFMILYNCFVYLHASILFS